MLVMSFKVGDKVRCIHQSFPNEVLGQVYTVIDGPDCESLHIFNHSEGYWQQCKDYVLVGKGEKPKKPRRAYWRTPKTNRKVTGSK